jgi:hypothetical protein
MIPLLDSRTVIELSETEIQVLIELEPLLRRAKLHLACPRCLAAGHGTRALVGGQNGPEDATWKVSCECTHRTYVRRKAS